MDRAVIDGLTLPEQFSYRPVAKKKRHSVIQTFGATRIHAPPDASLQVPGDSIVEFSIEAVNEAEWGEIKAKFAGANMDTIDFVGYWGDEWQVVFTSLDNVEVGRKLFNVTGSFRIVDDPDPVPTAPTAAFSGTPTSGSGPLTVQFTDASSDSPTA